MAGVLGNFRAWSVMAGLIILPLVAYVMMHHPNYTEQAALVNAKLSQIADEEVRNQMITPITMTLYLPVGMMGAFAMVMFASFVSTHDTYLHSWGSIFIQDVVLPLRKKPLTPKQHIRWLRRSIFGVAPAIAVVGLLGPGLARDRIRRPWRIEPLHLFSVPVFGSSPALHSG